MEPLEQSTAVSYTHLDVYKRQTFNLTKNPDVHISFKGFKPQIIFVKNILSVGIPSIIMSSVGSAMTFGMNKILIDVYKRQRYYKSVRTYGIFF